MCMIPLSNYVGRDISSLDTLNEYWCLVINYPNWQFKVYFSSLEVSEYLYKDDGFPNGMMKLSPQHLLIMFRLTSLAVTFLVAISSAAETTTTVYTATATSTWDSSVPTDAPLPGDYTGALRPQIHYSPPQNFMNDPNGLFKDAEGVYHVYYQCNLLII